VVTGKFSIADLASKGSADGHQGRAGTLEDFVAMPGHLLGYAVVLSTSHEFWLAG